MSVNQNTGDIMEQEEIKVKDIEHIKDKVKIIFASILGALLVLVEVYLMINSPLNYIAIALFGVLILIDLYFLVTSLIEISYRRETIRREQYEGIYKAEKASYMIFRKYFESLAKTLNSMDEKLDMPAEEIISAQKAVAKVTINRSKENTDALMNSNDKLIEKLFEFQDMLSENNEKLLEKTAEVNSQNSKENEARIGELTGKIREMELSIKNEIYQTVNKMILSGSVVNAPSSAGSTVPSDMTAYEAIAPESIMMGEEMIEEPVDMSEMMGEEMIEEPVDMPEMMAEEMTTEEMMTEEVDITSQIEALPIDEMPSMETEAVAEEPIIEESIIEEPVAEDIPPMPDLSDPNKQMSPDDIAALIANMNAAPAEESASEDTASDEAADSAEEAFATTELAAEETPVDEAVAEEPIIEEPVAEDIPPMPDLSDPNKQMSPDDIAALIANMNATPAEESTSDDTGSDETDDADDEAFASTGLAAEESPVDEAVADEPIIEDIPAMPDMSDPNKMMTPDEIEALFANL